MKAFLLIWFILSTIPIWGDVGISMISEKEADFFINDMKQGTINPKEVVEIRIKQPGTYVLELRAHDSHAVHREEIVVNLFTDQNKSIHAFPNHASEQFKEGERQTGFGSERDYQKALTAAYRKAREETRREEEAIRRREREREAGRTAFLHLMTVETDKRMSERGKQKARIRLLGNSGILNALFGR